MLKRFLCLMMAFMLLAGTALGEGAYQATITFDISQEAAAMMAKELASTETEQASLAEALVELVEGTGIKLIVQESGASCAIELQDEVLLDFSVFTTATESFMCSNLLPDHYMYASISQEESNASAKALEQLGKTDWTSVLDKAGAEFEAWLERLYVGQEVGNFMGDAYEGGARRIAFSFDDSDIAALMDIFINVLASNGVDDALLSAWLGAEGLLSSIVALNSEIASANRYAYMLYIVLNENDAPVGISLLTMEDDEMVMTLSLGLGDNGWHAVWGYGLDQQNVYFDLVLIDGENEFEKDFSLTVYTDLYREGFRAVEPYLDYMQMLYTGTVGLEKSDDSAQWYADVECFDAGESEPSMWCRVRGESSYPSETLHQTISWYLSADANAQPSEAIHFSFEPCERLTFSADGLQALNVEEASFQHEFDELMNDGATDLMIKLFKMIPAPLLTYIMQ